MELPINQIINADCLEFMKTLPDKCIDLVLTDPPYGINADKGVGGFGSSKTDNHYDDNWDSKTPTQEVFNEILRIGKKVVIFGGQFFTDKLPPNGHWIVWDKKGNIQFDNPFGDCELAWTNIDKKSVKKYTVIQQGFVSEERDRFHPTQKPVSLFKMIIQDNTEEGGVVLDCFLGSGTTAVACKQLKRNYIGIEISDKYCEIAKQRLRQEILL
jgi:site-specific DNA-methyltransferase (adenine-specific)